MVTTPQLAAAEVAERAGSIALQTRQRVVGVVENMSGLVLPDGSTMQVFGEGGGEQVAERLTRAVGADVPLLGQIPLDPALVAAGDAGMPLVLSAPDSPAGKELRGVADSLSSRRRGLAGMSLGWTPAATLSRSGGVGVERRRPGGGLLRCGADSAARGLRMVAAALIAGCVEGAGEERVVAVEQMLGQRRPRRHAPQLLQFASGSRRSSNSGPRSSRSWLVAPLR